MQADAEDTSRLLTPEEAVAAGYCGAGPEPGRCEWCGRELEARGVEFGGRMLWVAHEPCGCEGEAGAARREDERKRQQARRDEDEALARAGIGRRFLAAKVDDAACARYLEGFGDHGHRGLYIHGRVGSGKTYAASAVAREFVLAGYRVVMTTTLAMLGGVQATFDDGTSSAEALRRFTACDVLVLDDMGKESASAWSVSTLFQIVDERYAALRPIVATSQYGIGALERRMARQGEAASAAAIASRLREMCFVAELPGGDRRG